MQLIRSYNQDLFPSGSVIAIGNFEGLHLGHQSIIKELVNKSFSLGLPSVVITFSPSPKQFFAKQNTSLRLMRPQDKWRAFEALGVDKVIDMKFSSKVACQTHQDFLKQVLVGSCNMKHLFVGNNFRFGHLRQGDVTFLKSQAKKFGFEVTQVPAVTLDDVLISSTVIRERLAVSDLSFVTRALGKPYCLTGYVCHGDKKGRLIGFPTANIVPPKVSLPEKGVYYVQMKGLDRSYEGVCNLGVRPTVQGVKLLCETHLFDFSADIYGKKVTVQFIKKIRDEVRFESLEALRAQIQKDVALGRSYQNGAFRHLV